MAELFMFDLVTDEHFFWCKTFQCTIVPLDVQRFFVLFHHSGHFFAFQFHQDLIVSRNLILFTVVFVLWASDHQIFFAFNQCNRVDFSSFQVSDQFSWDDIVQRTLDLYGGK